MFAREDWTLFRTIGTLGQKAGVPSCRIRRLVAKELTDNALDVAGNCKVGMLPSGGFFVEDDGDGIPGTPEEIASLFSIKRPLVSTKLLRLPTRGALGNGLRVVAGAVLASGGTLQVWTRRRHLQLAPQDSGATLVRSKTVNWPKGTRIEVTLGPSLSDDSACLSWASMAIGMAGENPIYKGKTSAHWYDEDAFFELLQAAGNRSVRDIVMQLDGCAGKKAGIVAADFLGREAASLSRAETGFLLAAAQEHSKAVKPGRLEVVGRIENLPQAYAKTTGTFSLSPVRGNLIATLPYTAEVWAESYAYDCLEVFVNRTPITGTVEVQRQKERTAVGIFGCGLKHSCEVGTKPLRFFLNIQTPYMPITTDGKEPDFTPFLIPVLETLEKVARKAKRASLSVADTKLSQKDIIIGNLDAAIAKASGNGSYRYSLRQIFYAIRPYVIDIFGKEPDYNYFSQVITGCEAEGLVLQGLYRDPRGTLYHPHLHEEIPLGTLAVEKYRRPEWTFNKILYSEKEGFFSILQDEKWPEKHDCALLTSKGYASRAARDVLDLLGETDEEIIFFCIHDADAAGTMIYATLQEGTQARPGRLVKIINLGLEPEEGKRIGLSVESVQRNKGRSPVASYVSERWDAWLQSHRIELNAMSTPQFLKWLDKKMKDYTQGKVVPPAHILSDHFRSAVRDNVRAVLSERILQEAGVEKRVQEVLKLLEPTLESRGNDLTAFVNAELSKNSVERWTQPVARLADEIVTNGV